VDFAAEYDDGIVQLTHEGGDVVPAGAVVTVTALDGSGTFRAVLAREFAPGDRVALAPGDEGELALEFGSPPSTDAEFDGRVRVQFTGMDGEVVLRTTLATASNASDSDSPEVPLR